MKLKLSLVSALVIGGSFFAAPLLAIPYKVDAGHSQIGFKIKHLFSKVPGRFSQYTASFDFDPSMKTTGNFIAEIDAASVSTDEAKRDEHLRGEDFFDVAKHPKITFKSTKVTPAGKNKFKVHGDMTIRGVTKPASFDFEYLGEGKDPWGNTKAGFQATAKINRKDWGINWNKALDSGGFVIGDEVEIDLNLEAENTAPKETPKAAPKK